MHAIYIIPEHIAHFNLRKNFFAHSSAPVVFLPDSRMQISLSMWELHAAPDISGAIHLRARKRI